MPCTKFESLCFPLNNLRPSFLFLVLLVALRHQANCLSFNYSAFEDDDKGDFEFLGNSNIYSEALQVTKEARGLDIRNFSGRVLYGRPIKLWSKPNGEVESFTTTFVLRITPQSDPAGEGMAFILTNDLDHIPPNSDGQWLGIVNEATNGSSTNNIVAVEFDTKKSFLGDLDDNHIGVDINSIYSKNSFSLNGSGVNLSSDADIKAVIDYNGPMKELKVFVYYDNDTFGQNTKVPIISMPLDLSLYLPKEVYVGFSASTSNDIQLNCVRSWSFNGVDVDSSIHLWVWIVVASIVGIVLMITILLMVGYKYHRGAHKPRGVQDDESYLEEIEISASPKKYLFKELKSATGNFNPQNELGRGGFGVVYKGILKGEEVAVKRNLLKNDRLGRKSMIAEVITIGELHQKNVVKLTGWCYEKNELLLVYEYMPNGSLDKLLFPQGDEEKPALTWERRYNIVCGIAQSLDYLHNGCSQIVLHRDIKTSNIMLDADFNPCLGDFGLARMYKASEKTHHTTLEIAGTPSYMAPEILFTSQATTQTDVYAFGVLLLEVVCGRKPGIQTLDGKSHIIVDLVWEFYESDMICDSIDPTLHGNFDKDQVECVLLLGLACCHPNPFTRPSMRSALQVLMGEALPPRVPFQKPAFVWPALAPSFARDLDRSFSGGTLSSPDSISGR